MIIDTPHITKAKLGRRFACASAVLAGALILATPVLGAGAIADVAADSPNYQAIKSLVDKGIMDLAPGGQFNPKQAVDRMTLAAALAKVLDQVASGQTPANAQDIGTIRKLAEQYHDELVQYYQRLNNVDQEAQGAQKSIAVTEEKLNQVLSALGDLQASLEAESQKRADLEQQLQAMHQQALQHTDDAVAKQRQDTLTRLGALQSQLDGMNQKQQQTLDGLAQTLNSQLQTQNDQAKTLGTHGQRLDQLDKGLGDLGGRVDTDEGALNSLQTKVSTNADQIGSINKTLGEHAKDISDLQGAIAGNIDALQKTLDANVNKLSANSQTNASDLNALRKQLSDEQEGMQQQLASLFVKLQALIDDGDKKNAADIAAANQSITANGKQIKADAEKIDANAAAIKTTGEQVAADGKRLDTNDKRIAGNAAAIAAVKNDVAGVQKSLEQMAKTSQAFAQALQDQGSSLQQGNATNTQAITALQSNLHDLAANVDKLEKAQAAMQSALQNADGQLLQSYQALTERVSELESSRDELQASNKQLAAAVAKLQEQLQSMQNSIGLSQDQLDKINKDVQAKLAEQLNLNLVREQQLERQVKELTDEFSSYRDQQAQENKSAKTLGTIGIAAGLIGLLLGVSH